MVLRNHKMKKTSEITKPMIQKYILEVKFRTKITKMEMSIVRSLIDVKRKLGS